MDHLGGRLAIQNRPRKPDVEQIIFMMVIAIIGVMSRGIGVATCFKQMWPVYVALGVLYLSLLGILLSHKIDLGVMAIVILVIIQGHRVLGYSKTLLAAGIRLNSKP